MSALASKRIVLIDDQLPILSLIRSLLEAKGARGISIARSGAAGLNLIRDTHPDLIICDIEMPRMSGLEVLKEIRTGRAGVSEVTPLIFLSGHTDTNLVRLAAALDANGFIRKPFQSGELADRIAAMLAQARSYKDILAYRAVTI
ncbi:MAG: response regulator [Elsteraceae bacterium]